MKKIILAFMVVVVGLAVLAYAFRRDIAPIVIRAGVEQNLGSSLLDELPDGLHVVICGAGSPLPDPERSGPCVAVVAGQRVFVVDVGTGGSRNLRFMRVPQGRIDAIFLSHFHSDHIDGLGEILLQRWINGAHSSPTPIHGPVGVGEIVEGLNRAYAPDVRYRVAHHGEAIGPASGAGGVARPFAQPGPGEGVKIFDDGEVVVTAFAVEHEPVDPAVGYRFDYRGRSVLVSGDTNKSANLELFAKDVDLLVHEALAPHLVGLMTEVLQGVGRDRLAKLTVDILDYHASPVEVAEIARDADVGALLFYHIVPPLRLALMEEMFLEGVAEIYDGPVIVARDGTFVSLPVGSQTLSTQELL